MPRTDRDKILAVLAPGKDYDTLRNPPLDMFIVAANIRVTWCIRNAGRFRRVAMDDTPGGEATIVETFLAAGLYKVSDPQWKQRSAGKSSGAARGDGNTKPSERNEYIITACAMDSSNVLRPALDGRVASTGWLGLQVEDQLPYGQRTSV